jgi:hypothetical protein
MSKLLSIVLASGLAVFGVSSLAGAASSGNTPQKQTKAPAVMPVLGAAVNVPVGQFVKAFAYCPRGYYVTGGGAYNGAITEIASSPTKDLRSWFVDGTNTDPMNRTFQHRADAICVKGNPSVSALTAAVSSARLAHQAELEFTARHASPARG